MWYLQKQSWNTTFANEIEKVDDKSLILAKAQGTFACPTGRSINLESFWILQYRKKIVLIFYLYDWILRDESKELVYIEIYA